MKRSILSLILLCGFILVGNGAEINFKDYQEQDWKFENIDHEKIDGKLRTRASKGAMEGKFSLAMNRPPATRYLQVKVAHIENMLIHPCVELKGGFKQSLFSGWNTFQLPENMEKLELSFSQKNIFPERGPGSWMDYAELRLCAQPEVGLTVEARPREARRNEPIGISDTLLFRYYGSPNAGTNSKVHCLVNQDFKLFDYRFNGLPEIELNDEGKNGDEKAGDGIYSASIVINDKSMSFKTIPQKEKLIVAVVASKFNSIFTMPFQVSIESKYRIDSKQSPASSPETVINRNLWYERTQGTNLALGKTLLLMPEADYTLTKDAKDVTDLTDGKLSTSLDDLIWWDRNAVGWAWINGAVLVRIDLGSEQPVDRLVIRLLGGAGGSARMKFPNQFDVYVSKDGKTYYTAASMSKVTPAEQTQSDFKKYYYLEENGETDCSTYMYPFDLSIQADARYIILKMVPPNATLYADELSVIKADERTASFNVAYRGKGREIPLSGMTISARDGVVNVINNVLVPHTFVLDDMRPGDEQKKHPVSEVQMVLELPEGLEIVSPKITMEPVTVNRNSYKRALLPMENRGSGFYPTPVFFRANRKEFSIPLRVYARIGGVDHFVTETPIDAHWELPVIPEPFKRLHVSLGWMAEVYALAWPDYFENWRRLGFNAVNSFPCYSVRTQEYKQNPKWFTEKINFLDAALNKGFKVIMVDSPMHEMVRGHKPGSEVFCDVPGQAANTLPNDPCPSYRGKYYKEEMNRIAECARISAPDIVFNDMELFERNGEKCLNCKAAAEKQGKDVKEFLLECKTELNKNIRDAIYRGAVTAGKKEMPPIGGYHRQPIDRFAFGENFFRIYPDYLNIAMPSLYVAGQAAVVHDNIKRNYLLLKKKDIIPWLTAGTFGKFESYKIEQMVLEALLNGSRGITYFAYSDFAQAPLGYYYHAKALAAIRPYEDLIMDGDVLELSGSNKEMLYSGIRRGQEMLLLVGNYLNASETTLIKTPFSAIDAVKDIRDNKPVTVKNGFVELDVPKSDLRLLYIKGVE